MPTSRILHQGQRRWSPVLSTTLVVGMVHRNIRSMTTMIIQDRIMSHIMSLTIMSLDKCNMCKYRIITRTKCNQQSQKPLSSTSPVPPISKSFSWQHN